MHQFLAVLPYPNIGRVAFQLGPVVIRWYALSYIVGLLLGWWVMARTLQNKALWRNPTFSGKPPATADDVGDLFVWATFGVILGGRIGWDLFYGTILCAVSPQSAFCGGLPGDFLTHPIRLISAWEGGMSFHGGLIGVGLAVWLFCRRRKLDTLKLGDLVASVAPIGLFCGRIANFINGELWGKPTDVPWAMVFPDAHDGLPRHPSQLYEAFLEGIVLFVLVQLAYRTFGWRKQPGLVIAVFLLGYGVFRFLVEFVREPDGPFIGWFSMGMALSVPVWIAGLAFLWNALRKPRTVTA